jgi:hypothetical protein
MLGHVRGSSVGIVNNNQMKTPNQLRSPDWGLCSRMFRRARLTRIRWNTPRPAVLFSVSEPLIILSAGG